MTKFLTAVRKTSGNGYRKQTQLRLESPLGKIGVGSPSRQVPSSARWINLVERVPFGPFRFLSNLVKPLSNTARTLPSMWRKSIDDVFSLGVL